MRLLERDAHLASLVEYAEEARAGNGRLVLLAGEAGVGKSSLVDELERELADAHWAWGACDGMFTPRPLAPLLDIGAQIGGALGDLLREDAPRDGLFAALLAELTGSPRLTVLVVEDVHWADEATLDLLRFVGRRIRDTRAMVVVTYRDDALAADDPLRVAVGELSTQRSTRRMSVPPLTEQAVATLAAGTRIDADGLHRLTGGNPFFVTEVLQTVDQDLPTSVRDAVLARVAGLSSDARGALDVASLIGARVQPDFLIDVTHADTATIDELVSCGVLGGDSGGQLRFRHEIARMAVQAAIAPHRTRAAHRDILDVLLASGSDDEARIAYHAEGAGDDDLVLTYAPSAGRRASDLASHREAAAQFERALRAASAADDSTVAALYDSWAHELALVDRWQDSADARAQALRRWRDVGDPLREGDSLRRLSRTMWRLCRGDEAGVAAVSALSAVEPLGPSPELAWAYTNLANHRLNTGQHEDAIRLARQARDVAEPLGLDDVVSDALNTEACASSSLSAVWSPLLHRSLDIAKAARLDEQSGRAYANLYALYVQSLRVAEGEGLFVEGLSYCDDHDIATFATCLRGERCSVLEKLGRWDDAVSLATGLLEQGGPSPVNRLNPLVSLGKILARRGDDGAWDCLDEAQTWSDGVGEPEWILQVRTARAEALWLEGRDDDALRELSATADAVTRSQPYLGSAVAAWQHRITGRAAAGSASVEPYISELDGDLVRAARLWDDLGFPYEAAVAMLASTDEAMLRAALGRLEALGATATARLARQIMRRHGVRSVPAGARRTTRTHPAGLTRREHEVLELICDGLTNDEIAGRLFVSVKTVDHHVSAVLAKLGVPSRKLAAREAAKRGIVGART